MSLYDEHTWGAFASVARPDSLFTKAQWNRKSGYAYGAAMETHDVLARAATALARARGPSPAPSRASTSATSPTTRRSRTAAPTSGS